MFWKTKAALMTTAACLSVLTGTSCSTATMLKFSIPREDLGTALKDFSRSSGVQVIVAADVVAGKTSAGAAGGLTVDHALAEILSGTGLHAEMVAGAYVVRRDPPLPLADQTGSAGDTDIVVTGTRIHGEAPIGAPLTVIDRNAIETSGRATVADYIQTLPQNYGGGSNEGNYLSNPHTADNRAFGSSIDLRGLGTESTLVLFDGNRPAAGGALGAFTDISLIPTSAIERIEILGDGASAIYGTDAVAGVVNIRFRNRFDGFETHLYQGVAGGALHQVQASQAFGRRWGSGGLFLAYQYDHRNRLPGDSRSFWTEDLRKWGGPDLREPYASPGTITAANGAIFGIPAGQDGRSLTASELLPGQTNLSDQRKTIDILPRQTTHSVYAAIDQKLTDNLSFYARGLFTHRSFDSNKAPLSLEPYTVPTTNPFYVDPIGTGEAVSVDYDFASQIGHNQLGGHLDAFTTSAGFKGSWRGWSLDLNTSYGRQRERELETNAVSATRVAIALADTDPATTLNLFGDGSGNNPATLDFIRSTYRDFDTASVWSSALRIDGSLFDVPAGTVRLALGAEHRRDTFTAGYSTNDNEASPDVYDLIQQPGTPGHRTVNAIYGELSIPLLNAAAGRFPGKLDASVAGRSDWYSDVGRTINPKVGLSWSIIPDIKVRGSWGTSFRAPSFAETGDPNGNLIYALPLADPQSPTGISNALLLLGYSPNMRPERATSWTAGVDLKPRLVPGLTIRATYFQISYRDRIASLLEDLSQFLTQRNIFGALIQTPNADQIAKAYADPHFVNPFGVASADINYLINVETQNLSRQRVRGVDFALAYTHALFGGTGVADLNGTRFIAIDQRVTSSSPASDVAGTILNPMRLRFRGHLGWAKAGFSTDAFVNYTGPYRNTLVVPSERVSAWTTFDAQVGYRFAFASPLKGARIALSATNLTNRKPPYAAYVLPGITFGYDPSAASAIGRQLSVDLTIQW